MSGAGARADVGADSGARVRSGSDAAASARRAAAGQAVKRVQAHHHRRLDAALTPHGLTLVQWDALRHLQAHPGASLHDLARLTFQSDQATGTLANRMVAAGLVERAPGGGRAVRLRITESGHERLSRGGAAYDEVLAETLADLDDDEVASLTALLARIVPPVEAGEGDGDG